MITKTPVGVVERDEQLAIARFPIAADARLELGKRDASPAGDGQRAHLHREPMRGDASDAKLSTPFDLVVTQDGRDHGGVASKLRAEKRCVWGQTPSGAFCRTSGRMLRKESDPFYIIQTPVLPKPPAPRGLCSSSVASTSSGVSYRANTSCAMRSPRTIVTGSAPRFCRMTRTSPR